jgi:hypothetical protein
MYSPFLDHIDGRKSVSAQLTYPTHSVALWNKNNTKNIEILYSLKQLHLFSVISNNSMNIKGTLAQIIFIEGPSSV